MTNNSQNFPGWKDIEKAKQAVQKYTEDPATAQTGEESFHVIEANKTHRYKDLPDGHYMMASQSFVTQQKIEPLHSFQVKQSQ